MSEPAAISPEERLLAETIGKIMEFWGFRRNVGRVWALLYLSDQPLNAVEIGESLGLSAGGVSMTLSDAGRWGLVHKVWEPGARKSYYEAETDIWKAVSGILQTREREIFADLLKRLEETEETLEKSGDRPPQLRKFKNKRIANLIDRTRLVIRLMDLFLDEKRIDASALSGDLRRKP